MPVVRDSYSRLLPAGQQLHATFLCFPEARSHVPRAPEKQLGMGGLAS